MEESASLQPVLATIAGKIVRAQGYKDEGNEHFKNGKFKKAISYYSRGLAYTKGLPGRTGGMDEMSKMASNAAKMGEAISREEESAVEELEVVLKSNIATCYIKLGDSENALKNANEALALRPKHWKAILRKGEAKTLNGDFDAAIRLFDEALTLSSDTSSQSAINKAKDNAIKLDKNATKKQKRAFKGMFEKNRDQQDKEKAEPINEQEGEKA